MAFLPSSPSWFPSSPTPFSPNSDITHNFGESCELLFPEIDDLVSPLSEADIASSDSDYHMSSSPSNQVSPSYGESPQPVFPENSSLPLYSSPFSSPSSPNLAPFPFSQIPLLQHSTPLSPNSPFSPPSYESDVKADKKRKRTEDSTTVFLETDEGQPNQYVVLSSEQLRTMTSDQFSSFVDSLKSNYSLTAADRKEIQRQKRLIRNREYAQRKRLSNKEKSQHIHEQVESQQDKIEKLESENGFLKSELFRMKSLLACFLSPDQQHLLNAPELPMYMPPKKRRIDDSSSSSSSSSPVRSSVVMFVFLFSVGIIFTSTVSFGGFGNDVKGAGRNLLSDQTMYSWANIFSFLSLPSFEISFSLKYFEPPKQNLPPFVEELQKVANDQELSSSLQSSENSLTSSSSSSYSEDSSYSTLSIYGFCDGSLENATQSLPPSILI